VEKKRLGKGKACTKFRAKSLRVKSTEPRKGSSREIPNVVRTLPFRVHLVWR